MFALSAGWGGAYVLLLGMFVALTGGFAAGWYCRRLGEAARKQALDAHHGEELRIVERARDRAREETTEALSKFERLRLAYEAAERDVRVVTVELTRSREVASELEQNTLCLERELAGRQAQLSNRDAALNLLQSELADRRVGANGVGRGNGPAASPDGTSGAATGGAESRDDSRGRQMGGGGDPTWLLSAPDGKRDDLQAIRGLGPTLERRLNALGIFHYRQLAAMNASEVRWLAARLKAFTGRIERDRWVEQAQVLAQASD